MSKHSVFDDPVEMVRQGLGVWHWVRITLHHPELTDRLIIMLMADAMKLPGPDGQLVRFCVTAKQQQQIADLVGGVFHSTRTADQRHLCADTKIKPITQIDGKICALSTDQRHSELMDQAIVHAAMPGHPVGLVSSVGKPWTLTQQMATSPRRYGDATAFNYGWHDPSAPSHSPGNLKLWQDIIHANSTRVHNDEHHDPSQVCEFPSNEAVLVHEDGSNDVVKLADMYQHLELWKLVSYEGPLKHVRQPSVPRIEGGLVVMPPETITPE